ncbi:MAG: hypothetical protein OEV31_03630 [Gammaproteobacteria bacterium]|nr:hypothetical protein [Gammaproteobacteria bacterium]
MAIDKARELLSMQAGFGGLHNANSARLALAEVSREHGQTAVDALICYCGHRTAVRVCAGDTI